MRTPDASGLVRTRLRLQVGLPAESASSLPPRARRAIAVAAQVGAPLLPALEAAASALDDETEHVRAVHVATSQARAVAIGLTLLPVAAVPLLGALLGTSLWRFYLTPAGQVVGAIGLALTGLGGLLARSMVVRVARRGPDGSDEVADLLATVLGAGLPTGAALRVVADAIPERGTELRRAALAIEVRGMAILPTDLHGIGEVLDAAVPIGAPAAPALRRHANDLRGSARADALAAAERLPVLLTFPTALCLLPASLLLVGAPLVADGLAAAGFGP